MDDKSIMSPKDILDLNAVREFVQSVRHQATPKDRVKERQGKDGKMYKYVDRIYTCESLDQNYPLWQFQVIPNSYHEDNGFVMILGKLSVIDPTTKLPRIFQCMGQEEIRVYADDVYKKIDNIRTLVHKKGERINNEYAKMAETDCLKRCASMLGLFNDVYSDDIQTEEIISEKDAFIFMKFIFPAIIKEYGDKPLNIIKQIGNFYSGRLSLDRFLDYFKIELKEENHE